MIRNLAIAFLLHATAFAQAQTLSGPYLQTYSNLYVQYTSEIDWKCIKVHTQISPENDRLLDIYKQARLHGGPVTITTPVQQATLNNATTFTVSMPESSRFPRQSYDMHWYSNDTVVITGKTLPALYVWQRPNTTDEPVDIPKLHAYLDKIDFTVPDQDYLVVLPTYDQTCD